MSNQREEETIPVGFRATKQQRDEFAAMGFILWQSKEY